MTMPPDDRKRIYAALAAPFPPEAIERTDGRMTGRGYSTTGLKYQWIANRLNEVLGLGGFRVSRKVSVREVATAKGRPAFDATCEIVLQLGEWRDGQFVPFAEAVGDGGHTAMSQADAIKGAFTNGFKKTAAFFGVGRQAYEGTLDDDNQPVEPVQPRAVRPQSRPQLQAVPAPPIEPPAAPPAQRRNPAPQGPTSQPPEPHATAPEPPAAERRRLTENQRRAIWAIAKSLGLGSSALRTRVKATFGVQPEFLSKEQASALIDELQNSANGGDTSGPAWAAAAPEEA
jgi:hypothetical protein